MVLENFALLAADTARTKAYLHAMIRENMLPSMCVIYSDGIPKMQQDAQLYKKDGSDDEYFDVKRPVLSFVQKSGMPHMLIENKDINSGQMADVLAGLEQEYLIYSGYGGYILKPHLFKLGKKFMHVHAGILPQYRGSTTAYYSFLQEKILGATAIFLSEGIDEGEVITQETFAMPKKPVDMDYVYEPYMRSRVLIKAVRQYLENGAFASRPQKEKGAETYFIIHPVLKHLAMMGMEKAMKQNPEEEM